ncbi:MAG: PA14 domain-containing protein, partial [Candidatus Aenigmarchaeota archaeon]|nr:PA14 domain-containing protein [Candidatus Aenigmarchaeota archaeon]
NGDDDSNKDDLGCTAYVKGKCKSFTDAQASQPTTDTTACASGKYVDVTDTAAEYKWICNGANNAVTNEGTDAACSASKQKATAPTISPSDDTRLFTASVKPTITIPSGTYVWYTIDDKEPAENAGTKITATATLIFTTTTTVRAKAFQTDSSKAPSDTVTVKFAKKAACGAANGQTYDADPSTITSPSKPQLCSAGAYANNMNVQTLRAGDGKDYIDWVWSCNGDDDSNKDDLGCTAYVKGKCGSASGTTTPTQPASSLCDAGESGVVIPTATGWTWRCNGYDPDNINEVGYDVECLATKAVAAKPVADTRGRFYANYYKNKDMTGLTDSGVEVSTLAQPHTEFSYSNDWLSGSPGHNLGNDGFSVKYYGDFCFEPGDYTFDIRSDDGHRVYIGDARIINKWEDSAKSSTSPQTFIQGVNAGWRRITVEYKENTGNAYINFNWKRTSATPCPANTHFDCDAGRCVSDISPSETPLVGNPVALPPVPIALVNFEVQCPVSSSSLDCIRAFSNGAEGQCARIKWDENKAIFSCNGLLVGSYNAVCKSVTGTSSKCKELQTTLSYSVTFPSEIIITIGGKQIPYKINLGSGNAGGKTYSKALTSVLNVIYFDDDNQPVGYSDDGGKTKIPYVEPTIEAVALGTKLNELVPLVKTPTPLHVPKNAVSIMDVFSAAGYSPDPTISLRQRTEWYSVNYPDKKYGEYTGTYDQNVNILGDLKNGRKFLYPKGVTPPAVQPYGWTPGSLWTAPSTGYVYTATGVAGVWQARDGKYYNSDGYEVTPDGKSYIASDGQRTLDVNSAAKSESNSDFQSSVKNQFPSPGVEAQPIFVPLNAVSINDVFIEAGFSKNLDENFASRKAWYEENYPNKDYGEYTGSYDQNVKILGDLKKGKKFVYPRGIKPPAIQPISPPQPVITGPYIWKIGDSIIKADVYLKDGIIYRVDDKGRVFYEDADGNLVETKVYTPSDLSGGKWGFRLSQAPPQNIADMIAGTKIYTSIDGKFEYVVGEGNLVYYREKGTKEWLKGGQDPGDLEDPSKFSPKTKEQILQEEQTRAAGVAT